MERRNIDVGKLTEEAECGHGRYVRSVLELLPFEEQIHFARQMTQLSKQNSKLADLPELELVARSGWNDEVSENGYSKIKLYRKTPSDSWGGLVDKQELIYQSSLNLSTGAKTAADNDM